jgi:hypothetical protein
MIEIRSRYGDKVIYTAKDAKDVRSAVEEAARAGANLTDAYLTDAYLRGADLRGADLTGADLTGADLTDANLRGADLTGADLRGAEGFIPAFTDDIRILLDQVEAVARAIHADELPWPWEDLKPWQQAEYRCKARVAIEAYQEWARIREARHQTTEGEGA